MCQTKHGRSGLVLVAVLMAGLLALPSTGLAQLGGLLPPPPTSTSTTPTVVGNASAAQVVLLGLLGTATSTSLASTGISSANAESDVGQDTGSIPSLLGAEVLNAATYSYPDQVDSAVSLANLNMSVAGIGIYADSVVAEASQVLGAAGSGTSYIDNLSINGMPVAVTGAPNQTIWVPGGQVIINEQTISSTGTAVVNALHVAITGVADVVIASATAGIS